MMGEKRIQMIASEHPNKYDSENAKTIPGNIDCRKRSINPITPLIAQTLNFVYLFLLIPRCSAAATIAHLATSYEFSSKIIRVFHSRFSLPYELRNIKKK
jgi:hypothetical protein